MSALHPRSTAPRNWPATGTPLTFVRPTPPPHTCDRGEACEWAEPLRVRITATPLRHEYLRALEKPHLYYPEQIEAMREQYLAEIGAACAPTD